FLVIGLLGTGAGMLALHGLGGPPEAAQAQPPADKAAPADKRPVVEVVRQPDDERGEPLPPGALARLGTTSFRHPGRIGRPGYAPDGKLLATSDYGAHFIRLWDLATGKEVGRLEEDGKQCVIALGFSPDGKTLASALGNWGENPSFGLTLWDVAAGKKR